MNENLGIMSKYTRHECLEIVTIPETMTGSSLDETALNIFEELGASINHPDIETCHRVGPSSRKKVIIKMSKRKDADRVWRVKKTLRV